MPDTDIESLIPHRKPFLFLDDIKEMTEKKIIANYTINPDDELFSAIYKGHYPGNPMTPGVILCEMIFQAGVLLMAQSYKDIPGYPVLVKISNTRFKQPVYPGETVEIRAELENRIKDALFMKGSVFVREELAVKTTFTGAYIRTQKEVSP